MMLFYYMMIYMYIINTFCMVNIYCAFKTNFVYRKYMYVYVHIYKVHVNQMAGFSSTLCTNLSNSTSLVYTSCT